MQERFQEIPCEAVPIGHYEQEETRIPVDPFPGILWARRQAHAIRSIPNAPGQRTAGVVERVVLVYPGLAVRTGFADL